MRISVRAAINLTGLGVGATALVDPDQPYIAMCLEAGYLVPTGDRAAVPTPPPTGATRPVPVPPPVAPPAAAGGGEVAAPAAAKPKAKPRKSRAKKPAAQDADPGRVTI